MHDEPTALVRKPRAPRPAAARRVVVVGLDEPARSSLVRAITAAHWEVDVVSRLAEGQHALISSGALSLVVSASLAGEDELRRLARQHASVGLFVWADAPHSDVAAGWLLAGAVDVLTARMGARELVARLGRSPDGRAAQGGRSTVGSLAVDTFRGEATWRGERMPLTSRERDVLDVLILEHGRTLRREVIYQRVWGHSMPAGDRNVDVNIKRLRGKIASATDGAVTIETISRVGYCLNVADPQEEEGTS